jgi:hypothetical protein
VGTNNSFIHGELLKGKRELDSALPAMASLAGIDPLRKFGSEVSMTGVVESPELEGALLHLSYS